MYLYSATLYNISMRFTSTGWAQVKCGVPQVTKVGLIAFVPMTNSVADTYPNRWKLWMTLLTYWCMNGPSHVQRLPWIRSWTWSRSQPTKTAWYINGANSVIMRVAAIHHQDPAPIAVDKNLWFPVGAVWNCLAWSLRTTSIGINVWTRWPPKPTLANTSFPCWNKLNCRWKTL